MKTALVTGANKGIGLGIARQLAQEGIYVYLGSRNLENGRKAVEQLKSEGLDNVETVQLDVTDQKSVDAARDLVAGKSGTLDILINNAGVGGGDSQGSLSMSPEAIQEVFETNYYGVVRMTQAFVDLMRESDAPRIVNVSTGLASQTVATDPSNSYYDYKLNGYQSPKTALNMYTIQVAYDLRDTNFRVNAVCPGAIDTDMNRNPGTEPVEVGAARIVKYALVGDDGPTGQYFSEVLFADTAAPW